MSPSAPTPRLDLEAFRLLRTLVNEISGILLPDESIAIVERKLAERVSALRLTDFHEYYRHLRYHPQRKAEVERAIDVLTTNETYFFRELPQLLAPGDLLVFNDTQVVKARLFGEKPTGGKLELLVERVLGEREVVAHMKVSKKPQVGTELRMDGGFTATLIGRYPDEDGPLFRFAFSDDPYALMERHGHVPLPPYITHADTADDAQRYQTVFAKNPGAVAAPTAALHFDEGVLAALQARGVERASVTLHVGAGTFQPVKTEDIAQHRMHSEWYEVPAATQEAIAQLRARGGRLVAVGTTTVRTLES
ncbi:MAG TPA: S-adenosylmethionine:tRNA ribosyltransferase-isomerase, partial [Polyangiales bacterium]|nr:S-adenosylmethionine:tRNA ribosyltransferase-isomerase [Polyangiales bacterium]